MVWKAAAVAALMLGFGAAEAAAGVIVLGSSRSKSCMESAFARTPPRKAVEVCTAALQDDTLTAQARAGTLVNRGVLLSRAGDHQAALLDYEAAARLDPKLGEVHLNRGSALIRLGRYMEGVAETDRGLALGLREPEKAYFNRAVAREALQDPRGAYLDFRRAARLKPDWPPPRTELARFTVRRP